MATQEDVQFHYDIDNDFFKLFLDKKYRVYSCGVWEQAENLEEAQKNKLKRIADYGHVKNGHNVLDIGCGWGGMLNYCIDVRGASTATGLTLSQAQYDYIHHLSNSSISVKLSSWAEFEKKEKFDSIISIGAMEHFSSLEDFKKGKQQDVYRNFFQCCSDFSTNDAHLGLQTIVTFKKPDSLQSMKDTHYLLKHVFPGSVLPGINDLHAAMLGIYEPVELKTIGFDYARTVLEWKNRLILNKEKIIKLYGEKLWIHYNFYFDAARRSFENGYTNLVQMSLRKII